MTTNSKIYTETEDLVKTIFKLNKAGKLSQHDCKALLYRYNNNNKNWGIGIQVDTYFIRTESRPEHIGQFVDDLIFRKSIQGTGGGNHGYESPLGVMKCLKPDGSDGCTTLCMY